MAALGLLLSLGALGGVGLVTLHNLPAGELLRAQVSEQQVRVDARDLVSGRKKYFMSHVVSRYFIPLESASIPKDIKNALVAAEDRRFYTHYGFDARGILRAAVSSLRGSPQGASTITQQLVKNTVLGGTREFPGVIFRKFRELFLAWRLERLMSKEEILTNFLNTADFGSSDGWTAFGIEQAARKYYKKGAADLNLYEAAELVGTLKATSTYSPILHPENARRRAKAVLERMVEIGFIKPAEAIYAMQTGSRAGNLATARFRADYYTDWLFEELVKITQSEKLNGELRFVVGLDPFKQIRSVQAIGAGLKNVEDRSATQAALVAMQPDGRILAMVGGRDFRRSQYNRATLARRQPASTFKLFVYAAGIESGLESESIVRDAPLSSEGGWPANSDGKYYGRITLRRAFEHSLNAATVRLASEVGMPHVVDMARRLGLSGKFEDNLGIALGSREVSLVELTAAYGVFGHAGRPVTPYGAILATDRRGYIVYRHAERKDEQVLATRVVAIMRSMLHTVVTDGTGQNAILPDGKWVAGKTGTSQSFRDAWFVGLTDSMITGVWFGNDDGLPMSHIEGSGIPAVTWRRFNEDISTRAILGEDIEIAALSANNEQPKIRRRLPQPSEMSEVHLSLTGPFDDSAEAYEQPQVVAYFGEEPPGTIIVSTAQRLLYLVQKESHAIRYSVAVGRPGSTWSGTQIITAKREWPDWHPTLKMLQRHPRLPRRIPGGPTSPLGARALYLGLTAYRIHGSNEPDTIGKSVSSGCIRMRNDDVIDLYGRVEIGTKVVVN